MVCVHVSDDSSESSRKPLFLLSHLDAEHGIEYGPKASYVENLNDLTSSEVSEHIFNDSTRSDLSEHILLNDLTRTYLLLLTL